MTANSVYMKPIGSRRQSEPLERDVEESLVAEDGHPAGRAHGIADEERQHQQHEQEILEPALGARQLVGQRKRQDEADTVTIAATRKVR